MIMLIITLGPQMMTTHMDNAVPLVRGSVLCCPYRGMLVMAHVASLHNLPPSLAQGQRCIPIRWF